MGSILEGRLDDGPVPGQRTPPLLALAEVARIVRVEDRRLTAHLDVSTNAQATRLEEIDVCVDPVYIASLGGEDPPPASMASEGLVGQAQVRRAAWLLESRMRQMATQDLA